MSHTVNLENYFTRIGYEGPRAATLEVLQELHRLHPRSIPFENLNPLTRRAVKLDLESVEPYPGNHQRVHAVYHATRVLAVATVDQHLYPVACGYRKGTRPAFRPEAAHRIKDHRTTGAASQGLARLVAAPDNSSARHFHAHVLALHT